MLKLFNTLSQQKEFFHLLKGKNVKMVSCGPSLYRIPHIGNYRTFLFEDILQRYLRYLGYTVTWLMTLTDIEDKAIIESNKCDLSLKELTEKNAQIFFKYMAILKIQLPTYMPRSSETVQEAVELIKILQQKELAYHHEGNVYFDPLKFENFGRLSRLDMSQWPIKKRRFHKDTYPGVRWNRGDFILWHRYKKDDNLFWDTDIGKGRPAWNVQDAAMITKHLGNSVDIVCGGVDNLARHHDYNIAVMEGISGNELSRYWVHGEHLLIEGKKMSKSNKNVIYPTDLLDRQLKAEHIRFFLIYKHYRKKLNFTFPKIKQEAHKLDRFKKMVNDLIKANSPQSSEKVRKTINTFNKGFEKGMNDDLNVVAAFNSLYLNMSQLVSLQKQNQLSRQDAYKVIQYLRKVDQVLQVIF